MHNLFFEVRVIALLNLVLSYYYYYYFNFYCDINLKFRFCIDYIYGSDITVLSV